MKRPKVKGGVVEKENRREPGQELSRGDLYRAALAREISKEKGGAAKEPVDKADGGLPSVAAKKEKKSLKKGVIRRGVRPDFSHWWLKHPCWIDGTALSRDEQKAAVFYEAFRRRPEVQDAWGKGIRGPKAMHAFGWQKFTAIVLMHLPRNWLQLSDSLRRAIVTELPEMLPPIGYSVWPTEPLCADVPERDRTPDQASEMKAYHERCRRLAARMIFVPQAVDQHIGLRFLKELRGLADSGFLLFAIDNKSQEAFAYGFQFLQGLQTQLKDRLSFRAADLVYSFPSVGPGEELPSWAKWKKLGKAKREALVGSSAQDEKRWVSSTIQVMGKRKKKRKTVGSREIFMEEKLFNFQTLCKGLAEFDSTGNQSDLMLRVRL
jgi:hypothetical protein